MRYSINIIHRNIGAWLHLAFWLVLGVLNLVLTNWLLDPSLSILRPMINLGFLALLFYINAWLVNQFLEPRKYWAYIFLANLLIWATLPLRFSINMQFLLPEVYAGAKNLVKGLIFAALATGYGIVLLSTIYQVLLNRYAAERRAMAMINQQTEAELQFLRAQINPHFLFNTLNNIYALAVLRSTKTADMVLKLSQLLRYVVYERKGEMVPLEKEVEHIGHFIELFRMRSETPLNIEFDIKGDMAGTYIEPMILIPMVENCFKHCDFDSNPEAFVHIQLSLKAGKLRFNTRNTINKADRQKDDTGGVGLENIRRRLELQHPAAFQLETFEENDVFEALFSLETTASQQLNPSLQSIQA